MSINTVFKKVLFNKGIDDKIKILNYGITKRMKEFVVTKRYIKRCKHCFPIYGREERQFLKKLKFQVENYIQNHEELTYEQLEREFGTPLDVVNEYFTSTEESLLTKRITFSRYIGKSIVTVILIMMIFFSCEQFIYFKACEDNRNMKVVPYTTSEYIMK